MTVRPSPGYRIEVRRSIGASAGLAVFLSALWVAQATGTRGIVLWRDIAYGLQYSILVAGPIAAAASAWAAAREHRCGTTELLGSLPSSGWYRRRPTLLAVTTWLGLGFGAAMLVLFVLGFAGAAWGSPDMSLLASAWTALIACTSVGFFVGGLVPFAATGPFLGVVMFVMIAVPAYRESSPIHLLTPISLSEVTPFFGVRPIVGLLQTWWFLSIGFTCLVGCWAVASRRRSMHHLFAFTGAIALALAAALSLMRLDPALATTDPLSASPTCEARQGVRVCVHPAYEALLPQFATLASRIVLAAATPVTAVIQDPRYRRITTSDGRVLTSLGFVNSQFDDAYTAGVLAHALVTNGCSGRWPNRAAQDAVASWILARAGYADVFGPPPPVVSAARRLEQQTSVDATRWIDEHIDELRSCRLRLGQMP